VINLSRLIICVKHFDFSLFTGRGRKKATARKLQSNEPESKYLDPRIC